MKTIFWNSLLYLSIFTVLITSIGGIIKWKSLKWTFKVFTLGQISYFLIFLATMRFTINGSTAVFSSLTAFVDCIVFAILYAYATKSPILKKFILFFCAIICAIFMLEFFILSLNLASNFKNTFIIGSSLLLCSELFKTSKINQLFRNSIFLIAFSKLLVVCYSLILEFFSRPLVEQSLDFYLVLYAIDLILHVLMQLVFVRAILLAGKQIAWK